MGGHKPSPAWLQMVGQGHDTSFHLFWKGWHRGGQVTVTLTSASCMAHFWDGIDTAPALISARFICLPHNETFSGLQRDCLQSLNRFTDLQRE